MGGAHVQSLTSTPLKIFGPLKGGGGGWDTSRYLAPGLSIEGGIFNEQQWTFVSICPHGGGKIIVRDIADVQSTLVAPGVFVPCVPAVIGREGPRGRGGRSTLAVQSPPPLGAGPPVSIGHLLVCASPLRACLRVSLAHLKRFRENTVPALGYVVWSIPLCHGQ